MDLAIYFRYKSIPMKSIALFLAYSLILPFFTSESADVLSPTKDEVFIKITEGTELGFSFDIKYLDWRNQVHVRSDEAIRTMTLCRAGRADKSYNIIGSELVILPMVDFVRDEKNELEVTFINNAAVVKAEIEVTETKD